MIKMTSAYANKVLKQLQEDKEYWLDVEANSQLYTASVEEEPVIPEYDYEEVAKNISQIDEKICRLKHAINVSNVTSQIDVGSETMSVDRILVRMAQLNRRKDLLDTMRKRQPKRRISSELFGSRTTAPEYEYINYDLDVVKAEYQRVSENIMNMQIALDKYNQTVEFEVDM